MESRLIVVVVFFCAVYQLTEAQLFPVSALNTSITNTTCRTSKLCVSSVAYCDPAGNSSCYFSSSQVSNGVLTVEISGTTSGYVALGLTPTNDQTQILTQGSTVFVCGNNYTNAFFETATQQGATLNPVSLPSNIINVQGSVTGDQSLNQSRTQCTFNIDLKSTFLNSALSRFRFPNLLNSTLFNFNLFNYTLRSLLSSSPFNSTIIPLLNSTLLDSTIVNSTIVNYTLLDLVTNYAPFPSTLDSPILSLLGNYNLSPSILNWFPLRAIDYFLSNSLGSSLNISLLNSTFNSTALNSTVLTHFTQLFNSTFQNSSISSSTLRDLLNSTLISVPAQLPFNITILNGNTNGTQLGNASTVFTSSGPLDLANPRSNVPTPVLLSITRNGCNSTKLCLSSASDCDPAGNTSCFFSSVQVTNQVFFFELSGTTTGYVALALTQNGVTTVFACGSNNYLFFFQTANQTGTTLTPVSVNTVYNVVGVVSQSQTLIQCVFNTSSSFNISSKSADTSYQVTILNGTTSGNQLGSPNTLYDSKNALDLSNPNGTTTTTTSSSSSLTNRLISTFCTNVLAVLLGALTLHII